jgi:CHAT domain-containing protein
VLQPRLGANDLLVQYLLLEKENRGYAVVLGRDYGPEVVDLKVGRTAVEPVVKAWRRGLEAGRFTRGATRESAETGNKVDRNPGERLANWLLAPLEGQLQGIKHLILVPNGPLHLLPFAALPVGDKYLVEHHSLSVLSASSLLALVSKTTTSKRDRLLAVGNPQPPPAGNWKPLPGAQEEIKMVSRYFAESEVHPVESARNRFVSGEVLRSRNLSGWTVHLALHGRAGRRRETGLVFSDGLLGVEDVYGLSLGGSPQVVLSACETAVGERLAGDEVVSLANAFLFAGANRVIASLWRVPDLGTPDLMEAFYEEEQKAPPAEALALAQRKLIKNNRPPRDWASFVLTGI